MKSGQVVSIQIAAQGGKPLETVTSIKAVAGQGLQGDRYFSSQGTFSKTGSISQQVTLIEVEALEALERDYGKKLSPEESRRNITTQGVALNHLVGKDFRVGRAVFRGIKLCEPCGYLEEITGKMVKEGLIHRGGLRAQIISGGLIKVGDSIELISE